MSDGFRFTRKVGAPLKLVANLKNNDETRFVNVTLYKTDGTLIGSPIELNEVATNLFTDDGLVLMPNEAQVVARYQVFKDAARTELDDCFEEPISLFEIDSFDPALVQPIAAEITAVVEESNVIGRVEEAAFIEAVIGSESVVGEIEFDADVIGTLEQENITGELDD